MEILFYDVRQSLVDQRPMSSAGKAVLNDVTSRSSSVVVFRGLFPVHFIKMDSDCPTKVNRLTEFLYANV